MIRWAICLALFFQAFGLCFAEDTLAPLVKRTVSAVVTIKTLKKTANSVGSGFVINPQGFIITNDHVVDKEDKVQVLFVKVVKGKHVQGKELLGRVILHEPKLDIAVIQVPAQNMPVLTIGNSEDVQQGDTVIAIGSPLGISNTVTKGIISNNDLEINGDSYIQSDVMLDSGNSGGPLIDQEGYVIGVNTLVLKDPQKKNSQKISCSIPINRVANLLAKKGIPFAVNSTNHKDAFTKSTAIANVTKEEPSNKFSIPLKVIACLFILFISSAIFILIRRRRRAFKEPEVKINLEQEPNVDIQLH